MTIESDSLLAVQEIVGDANNLLEVGHITEYCKTMLRSLGFLFTIFENKQIRWLMD